MDNLIIEEAIKLGKEALKNGASLSDVQRYLGQRMSGLNLDSKQKKKYERQIANLDKSSVKVTSWNAKKMAVIAGITIATTATTFAVVGQIGCGSNASSEAVSDVGGDTKEDENTVSSSAMAPDTEEVEETKDEVATNARVNDNADYVLPDYLTFNANDMEVAKANIADFINDGLAKGLGTVENKNGKLVSSFTKDNLTKKVEAYLMLYLGANINQIDYKVLAELNQEGNLTANQIYETAITTLYEMYDDSYTLMSEDDKLAIEKIFDDKNDVKYINSIIAKIIKYNNAYNNAKSDSEKKEIIKEGIIAKEDLLKYAASRKLEVNPLAMDYAFLELEALDNLANGQIITDNEDDIKLYNNIVAECLTEEQIERYGIKEQIKQFSGLGVEESSQNLVSVMRNMFHGLVVDKMDAALAYADNVDKNVETSFNYTVKEIADKIDLSNFKANPYSSSEWIWKVNNNGMTLDEVKAATKPSTKTVIVDNVKPESVPEKDKAKPQVTYTDKNTGEKLTETYVKAKKAAIEDASRDLANKWKAVGDINKIGLKSVPSNIPGENSNNYSAVYNYWYAITWNDLLEEYQLSVIVTNKENNEQKPTSESVSKNESTVVDKSDNYNNPTPAPEVTFVPEGGTVVVEEGYLKPDEYTPVDSSNNNNNVNVEQGTDINEGIMSSSNNNNSNNNVTTEQGMEINEGIMMDSSRSDAINSLKALRDELTATINNADILGTNTKVR